MLSLKEEAVLSEFALVKEVHRGEVVARFIERIEVVDGGSLELFIGEAVGTHPCNLHELINELLLHANGVVGAICRQTPLVAVLFRVVLC